MLHPQLTLSLGTVPSSSFETFLCGVDNSNAVSALKALCDGALNEKQLFFWGEPCSGKTHLLSAACQHFAARGFQVAYLTGELASNSEALSGMEQADLLCIDDVHLLHASAEESLFHCINRCRDADTRLIFASGQPIDELGIVLPDLKTRLTWGLVFQLHTLSDDELPDALNLLLGARAMEVGDEVIDYVLRRYPRNMAALHSLVEQLDQATLSEHRKVTIPLVKRLSESMA